MSKKPDGAEKLRPAKLTINNRRINKVNFEKEILIPKTGDELDCYREEYNNILLDKAGNANGKYQRKSFGQ